MWIRWATVASLALASACTSAGRSADDPDLSAPAPTAPAGGTTTATAATTVATTTPVPTSDSTAPTSTATTVTSTVSAEQRAELLCSRTGVEVIGQVTARSLDETSGLAASRVHPGVLWAHNDGGERPGVYAIGPDGADLGFHQLRQDALDVEDMAIAGGVTGDELYLGDIGDNREVRSSIAVFRFPEPDPAAPGPIPTVERFEFVYPDRPHNAEALFVDEANGRVVIVTKEQASGPDGRPNPLGATALSLVFEAPLDAPNGAPVELASVGIVDTELLEERVDDPTPHPATFLGFGGVATGGDVSADGTLVALRTYEAVWVWPRPPGHSVAEVFGGEPCRVQTAPEDQGEAVAFVADGLITIGEGVTPPIHRLGG